MNEIAPALLEGWMREYYFNTQIDIGNSGVENFSLAELYQLTDLTPEEPNFKRKNRKHPISLATSPKNFTHFRGRNSFSFI
jgi:hypothetical protein